MKRITTLIALFCVIAVSAQPLRPSQGREPIRSEVIAYPTIEEALAAGSNASKYLTPLNTWSRNEANYTTDFIVPFAWANRQVLLHVASASSEYEVIVNGKTVGNNANPNAPADFNITRFANEGANRLEIRLAAPSKVAILESRNERSLPTLGHSYLLSQPTLRVHDVVIKSWPTDCEMKAEVGIVVRSSALNPRTSRIHYELRTPTGETVASGHKDIKLDMQREDTVRFVATIPELLQWSEDLPTQYDLVIKTQHEGRYAEYIKLKVGFRTISMKDGDISINGRPVTLRAVEVSPDITENQIALLKEQGYNTLKLRPGITPEKLYTACNMLGVYIIVQAPIDTHASGTDIRKGGNPTNDPAWLGDYLERTEDSYHTAKRHPSVIGFSFGTRSANGYNLYESYLNLKRMDETRPFIYYDAGDQWNNDRLKIEFSPLPEAM